MYAARQYEPPKRLKLVELIPNVELKFPGNHVLLGGEDQDQFIVQAIRYAVRGGMPTVGEGRWLFYELFGHVQSHLGLRTYSRDIFWQKVAHSWEKSSGVSLTADDIRGVVLAITRAERKYAKEKSSKSDFLARVRAVNEYFRVHESDSDEAAEILEEIRVASRAKNIFQSPPKIRIAWTEPFGCADDQPACFVFKAGTEGGVRPSTSLTPTNAPEITPLSLASLALALPTTPSPSLSPAPAAPPPQSSNPFNIQDGQMMNKKKKRNRPGNKQRKQNKRREERERKEREEQDKSQATTTAAEIHPNPFTSLRLALKPVAGVKRGSHGDSEDEPPLKRLKTATLVVRGGRPEAQPMGESSDE